jgi:2-oxoglutarate ferredoxin oxidoreductase subunit alpha
MLKLESARAEMGPPELWGPEDADMTLISWGSTQCAVRGAVERLSGSGLKVNSMEFNHIHPLPIDKVATALSTVKKGMLVESNYTGQFARHLRAEVGFVPDEMCLRYDGEPMTSSYIVYMVKEVAP